METVRVRSATLPSGLHLPFAETGSPSGVPVLLVHAFAESWRYFDPVLRIFKGELLVIQIYCPDQLPQFQQMVEKLKTAPVAGG
jgi:hypothetical protein